MGQGPSAGFEEQGPEADAFFSPETADCVFTVYFEGTANVVDRVTTQVGLFHQLDGGTDVRSPQEAFDAVHQRRAGNDKPVRLKMGLNGAENGLVGVVFAYGMGAQCEAVAAVVKAARCALGATATMQLNVVGLSRGAVSALAVAAMLGQRPEAFSGGGAGDYDGTKPEALSSLNKRASKSPPPVAAEAAGHAQTAAAPADQSTSGRGATADEASGGDASTSRWTKWLQPAAWSAPSAEAAVPPPAAAPRRVRVVVPAGMHPGDDVNFVVDGRTLRAKIPIQLSKRGDQRTFDVVVPPGAGQAAEAVAAAAAEAAAAAAAAAEARRPKLRLHLVLLDPVPGNQIVTASLLDPFGFTTTAAGLDVSRCTCLRRVLAVYPYEPLPAFTFHAPLVPRYPPRCRVAEVATLGCHQGAALVAPQRVSCRLSYAMLREFLTERCAVKLQGCAAFDDALRTAAATLRVLELLRVAAIDDAQRRGAIRDSRFVVRDAHATEAGVAVVRHAHGTYLNAFHHHLALRCTRDGAAVAAATAAPSPSSDENGTALPAPSPSSQYHHDGEPLYLLDVCRPKPM